MNIKHSAANDSWQTPEHILYRVRKVLGGIDFDPASSAEANKVVRAQHFLTREDDALTTPWPSPMNADAAAQSTATSVYLNPPGGKLRGRSLPVLFWDRLMDYRAGGGLSHGIFAFFSIEGLQTTQTLYRRAMDFPICIPAKRVRWEHPSEVKKSPTHASAFVYVPGRVDRTQKFIEVFSDLGACKR